MARYGIKNNKNNIFSMLYISKIIGAFAGIVGFFLLFALPSYKATDPSWFYYSSDIHSIGNLMGIIGAYASAALLYYFGPVAYTLIPFCLYVSHCCLSDMYQKEYDRIWISPITIATLCLLFHFYAPDSESLFGSGGLLGRSLYLFLLQWVDRFVIALGIYTFLLGEFLILTRTSFIVLAHTIHSMVQYLFEYRHIWLLPIIRLFTKTLHFCWSIITGLFKIVWKFLFVRSEESRIEEQYNPAYQEQEKNYYQSVSNRGSTFDEHVMSDTAGAKERIEHKTRRSPRSH